MQNVSLRSVLNSTAARVLTGALLLQGVLFYSASGGESAPPEQPLDRFPTTTGVWRMVQQGVVEKEVQDVLRADDTLTRTYQSTADGASANLFVAYFHTQRTGQSPHSPKNCLPGAGWSQTSSGYMDVPIPSRHETISINRYIIGKGDAKSAVLYWYQTPKRVIANEFDAKFWLIADSVRDHRSDTSLVRIVVPVYGNDDQRAVDTGVRFAQTIYPLLRQYLPT